MVLLGCHMLKSPTRFNFGQFPLLTQTVTSTVIISPITSTTLHFKTGALTSLPIRKGVSILASIKFPKNCDSDKFCKFAGILVGKNAVFTLTATISSTTYFPISALLSNLNLGKGIVLAKAGIEIVGGTSARIGLVGEVTLEKPLITLAARISASLKGLSLELSMTNCWNRAFNVNWLTICNLLGSIDFAPPTGITGLAFGAEIYLGYKSTGHQINAKGYIGVSIIDVLENYYYVKFSSVTMGSLLKAFKINKSIPRPIAVSGFPNGFLSSFSPTGKELPEVHLSIPAGYRLKGMPNILGLQGYADITIGLPTLIDIKVALPPIRVGGLLTMSMSRTNTRKGPFLRAKVQLLPSFSMNVRASGYLKVLGISLEAKLIITNTHYEYFIRGKVLQLFEASMHITASFSKDIRKASFRVRGEFKLDLFKGIKKIGTSLFKNFADTAKKAFQRAKKAVDTFLKSWKKARQESERAWKKFKSLGGIRAQSMTSCNGKGCRGTAAQGKCTRSRKFINWFNVYICD